MSYLNTFAYALLVPVLIFVLYLGWERISGRSCTAAEVKLLRRKSKRISRNITSILSQKESDVAECRVLYATQSGQSQSNASYLARHLREYGIKAAATDLQDFNLERAIEDDVTRFFVFITATYGDGEPPDSVRSFDDWLKDCLAEDDCTKLVGMDYAIMGMGDRSYPKFNQFAKDLDEAFTKLGARRHGEMGLIDASYNMEVDVAEWRNKITLSICEFFNVKPVKTCRPERLYSLEWIDGEGKKSVLLDKRQALMELRNPPAADSDDPMARARVNRLAKNISAKNPYPALISGRTRLDNDALSKYFHVRFAIPANLAYKAGDHVGVCAVNDSALVERLLHRLGIEERRNDLISLNAISNDPSVDRNPFPCPLTIEEAFTNFVDINKAPSTGVLETMRLSTTDEEEQTRLKSLIEDIDAYQEYCIKPRRNLVEVLEEFKHVRLEFDLLLELLDRLSVRYYSVCSAPEVHPTEAHVVFKLIEYASCDEKLGLRKGLATPHMIDPKVDAVNIFIRSSHFRLPRKFKSPVIMIGAGTGVAPFLGFLQERSHMISEGKELGEAHLFFGCRHPKQDFLFEDEFKGFKQSGVLTELHVAFSRLDPDRKVYVQDVLKEQGERLRELLHNDAHVYVCGDAKTLAISVKDTIAMIVDPDNLDKGILYVKEMQQQGRYSEDVWTEF